MYCEKNLGQTPFFLVLACKRKVPTNGSSERHTLQRLTSTGESTSQENGRIKRTRQNDQEIHAIFVELVSNVAISKRAK